MGTKRCRGSGPKFQATFQSHPTDCGHSIKCFLSHSWDTVWTFPEKPGCPSTWKTWQLSEARGDFPGGPLVENLPSNAEDTGSIPGRGTNLPNVLWQRRPRVVEPVLHKRSPCASKREADAATKAQHGRKTNQKSPARCEEKGQPGGGGVVSEGWLAGPAELLERLTLVWYSIFVLSSLR